MRRVHSNPKEGKSKGAIAKENVKQFFSTDKVGGIHPIPSHPHPIPSHPIPPHCTYLPTRILHPSPQSLFEFGIDIVIQQLQRIKAKLDAEPPLQPPTPPPASPSGATPAPKVNTPPPPPSKSQPPPPSTPVERVKTKMKIVAV